MLTQVALKELRGVQKEISAANDFVIFASRDKWSFLEWPLLWPKHTICVQTHSDPKTRLENQKLRSFGIYPISKTFWPSQCTQK